jgi:hypothetical protein
VVLVVIKLEGGTDFDLTVLDQPEPEDPGTRSRNNSETVTLDQRLAQSIKVWFMVFNTTFNYIQNFENLT